MSKYKVKGIDQETGLRTEEPVEADSKRDAVRAATHDGIDPTSVRPSDDARGPGARPRGVDLPEAQIPSEEFIEKTSANIQPSVLAGWSIVFFVIPAAIFALAFLGNVAGVSMPWLTVTLVAVVAVLLGAAVLSFKRYWS
ncbi:MAG: hypothetical protein ACF8PN_10315 [Phycisphaerales bacterium]